MISVVIPALNEEGAIADTIESISKTLGASEFSSFEIIIVNDGSSDNTGGIAKSMGARVVHHLYPLGYGRALKDGIIAAKYDTICILDADGTYPAAMLPDLLRRYAQGYSMIVGARQGAAYHESWFKKPLRRILRFLVEFTAGSTVPDVNSGMRVFSKKEILPIFNQLCETFSFTTSSTLSYLMSNRCISYVPIEYSYRVGKTKVKLFKDSLRTLQFIVQAVLFFNPIKLFILISAASIICGLVFSLPLLVAGSYSSAIALTGLSFLMSCLIFSLGLIADLMRQQHISDKWESPGFEEEEIKIKHVG